MVLRTDAGSRGRWTGAQDCRDAGTTVVCIEEVDGDCLVAGRALDSRLPPRAWRSVRRHLPVFAPVRSGGSRHLLQISGAIRCPPFLQTGGPSRSAGFRRTFVSEIYVLPLDSNFRPSGEARRLTDHKRWSAQPVWIRGGRSILYVFGDDV